MVTAELNAPEVELNVPGVIDLVSRPAKTPSGLSRYADTLARYLHLAGVPLRQRPTQMPRYMRPLARLGKAAGYDLQTFFENYPFGGTFSRDSLIHLTSENLAALLVFNPLKPSIVTVHGFFGYLLRNDPELRVYRHVIHRFFDSLVIRGLRRADHLICVSQYIKNVMVEQIGIHPSKITVIYEAVDHETFFPAPVPDSFYERFGLSRHHRYVLYVGSEQPRKNFLTLLKAFARLRARMPDVRLLKVGRPEYVREREKALRMIDRMDLGDSVIFAGHLAGELPDFYRIADVFVFPSRYEGFGFPPLEAMACGTPVICSNAASLPEVVGNAALLFDPMDEMGLFRRMEDVLNDPKRQMELVIKGIGRAGLFTWDKTARETIEVYFRILSSWSG